MAEMNELLEQAIEQCEGLAAEADSFGSALGSLDGQVSEDERRILSRSRDNVDALQQELGRLRQLDAKADEEDGELRERLAESDEALAETEEAAHKLLEESRSHLQEVRAERERIGAALKEASERAREEIERLSEALRHLEDQAEERLGDAEDEVQRIEDAVRDAIGQIQGRTEEVRDALEDAQDQVGRYADVIVTAQGTLGQRTAGAASHYAETAERAGEVVVGFLGDVLGLKLSEVLDEKAEAVSDRIGELSVRVESSQKQFFELQALMSRYQQMQELMSLDHEDDARHADDGHPQPAVTRGGDAMAQRDEGLDKLESFIGAAAETRAVLQREAEALADMEDEVQELGERFDHEMKNLGTTARELDARYGPTYEQLWMIVSSGLAAHIGIAAAFHIGHLVGQGHRQGFIAAADALEFAYEHFPEARQAALEALQRAEAAASDAFDELKAAAQELGADVPPLTETTMRHLGGVRAQVAAHLEAGS